ncbi:MAG TPA: hypothetical protein VMY76_16510 [Gemmatimonadales bacterium]|nr:hypothetical protein [Gemmatimonadales bacterium]
MVALFAVFLVAFFAFLAVFRDVFPAEARTGFRATSREAPGVGDGLGRVAAGAGVGAVGAAGVTAGGYSFGSGSIQPDPDQPISI